MSRPDGVPPVPGIPVDAEGPVFAEPWQAQAFAMAVGLHAKGLFTWSEWAEALGREIAAAGPSDPPENYYRRWLAALEGLVEEKGAMTHEERLERIAAWDRAAHATPHGMPIELGAELEERKP